MSDLSPFCFVSRQDSYMKIAGTDRSDSERRGNSNPLIRPVEFCHDGSCNAEGKSVLEAPGECSAETDLESDGS